jgi:CTP synthase
MPKKIISETSKKTVEHEFYNNVPKNYKKGKKYIIVIGSVISGIGKGTITSCISNLFSLYHGYRVSPLKFDGYLNYDAGTLNPYRHGEVFVLDDGTECDQDLGSYERSINRDLIKDNYLTAGKIFKSIIDKERRGAYLGRDVQFVPHVTGEIKGFLRNLAVKSKADIVVVEVGGTVGDIENSYFLEAMRELAYEEGKENVCFINVVYILKPGTLGEHKSKAAQLGIKSLMSMGIQPDIIICRSETPITEKIKEKISVHSNVPVSRVINSYDFENIHHIPLFLKEAGLDSMIYKTLRLKQRKKPTKEFEKWVELTRKIDSAKHVLNIALTGKYTELHDSYISILKALEHTAPYYNAKVKVKWVETTNLKTDSDVGKALEGMDGVIVPGAFGSRGAEGKILCIKYVRENGIPFLGLCYGFQMAIIEFARNVCGIKGANSTEIDPKTREPVIDILPEQKRIEGLGGSMRLGGKDVEIKPNTMAYKMYGKTMVRERFRHRYECNPKYIEILEKNGLVFSGKHPQYPIMQILELPTHPFFLATQFHPEFTSKPLNPNPLYRGFIKACLKSSTPP